MDAQFSAQAGPTRLFEDNRAFRSCLIRQYKTASSLLCRTEPELIFKSFGSKRGVEAARPHTPKLAHQAMHAIAESLYTGGTLGQVDHGPRSPPQQVQIRQSTR